VLRIDPSICREIEKKEIEKDSIETK
jgi:hypothetical protein